jgi:hypothetical protein
MDKKAAISKILRVSQIHANNGVGIGGTPSIMSSPQSLQPQLNQAIQAFAADNDAGPLRGVVAIMQTTNALSEAEADEILAALDE